jgi:benzoyl-CoA reductase subunit BamC
MGKNKYFLDGKEYSDCDFCRAACPSRTLFHEPDSGLPLKCDMCEENPEGVEPWCVQWCITDALIYEEHAAEATEDVQLPDLQTGLAALIDTYGLAEVLATASRLAQK